MRFYILRVDEKKGRPIVYVSRSHPNLVRKLFENEVPEIASGVVEIVAVSREAGSRTKIAVASRDENVEPVGSCVGQRGLRVQAVMDELMGEKIDIIQWSPELESFIANSLNPAKVLRVDINEAENTARVVVPDHQLSLAIGREGQNARLAARLTGWKIDIKSESRFREMLEQEILARFTAATESAVNESEAQADAVNGSESQPDAAGEPVSEPAPASAGDASAEQTD
jgi:N utilization substance protein A